MPSPQVRPTVPGRIPGATVVHVGPSKAAPLTPRQLARARAKLEHAAKGHAQLAANRKGAAAAAHAAGRADEAGEHLAVADEHEKILGDYAKKIAALK